MPGKNLAQDWPLRNDQIVMMALGGMKQRAIAEQFDISHQAVSVIIRHPKAEEIIRIAKAKLQEKLVETIDEKLGLTARLAVKVIKKTLDADISPIHKAKANQDRVAIALLRGRGYLRQEGQDGAGGFQVSPEQFDKLTTAMRKSDEAQQIQPLEGRDVEEGKVIDAEVLEVTNEPVTKVVTESVRGTVNIRDEETDAA